MKKLTVLLSILILAGCTTTPATDTDIQSSNDTQTIITSFYPVEYLTKEIVGENFEVLNLTQGKDPHSYSLTPQDIQNVENSDLFIFQGAGLEPWAEDFEDSESLNILELSENIDLLEYSEEGHDEHHEDYDHSKEDHHEGEHKDEHDDEHHDEESDHHAHDHGEFDPHTWLDPILAQEMASQILSEIIKLDPNNEDLYNQNYQALASNLNNLNQSYASTLEYCTNKKAISSHDAFSYLEERYDFELVSVSGLSPQSIPSSQKLQELITLSNQENVTHILLEEFTDQSFSDVIKSEANLDSLIVNTLESTPPQGEDYVTIMEDNLETFAQAFSCN